MADGRQFENHYRPISISQPRIVRITRNLVCGHKFYPRRWRRDKKIRNSPIQDGGRTPYWKSFFVYNSAPSCQIKMKFRVRRHNRTHTEFRWSKNVHFRKSNMADGGTAAIFENHYISISQPQIVRIARNLVRRHTFYRMRRKRKKIRNSQIQNGGWTPHWKSLFGYNSAACCPIQMMEWGGRITRIRSRSGDQMPN